MTHFSFLKLPDFRISNEHFFVFAIGTFFVFKIGTIFLFVIDTFFVFEIAAVFVFETTHFVFQNCTFRF